ncbi:MAG: aminomethyl-transferring glycine dehydrogenase subunit GcvPA, partial [Solirubrobacteraceae bacterium]|nr:aminomethyl-transferring glycine dehydrogenase subunit GcvPA [Solirubrobacteraceae bacterium]
MSRYTAVTDADRAAMLDAIGVSSLEELFDAQIPAGVRLRGGLDLPDGLPEQDVFAHLLELSKKNTSAEDEITFLGAGMYDHYIPAAIDMLLGRSEFLTPYTPYQPEVSQGGLQVMFEYQTAICELTGMDVSNASVYEGPSAVAAAGYLAKLASPKRPVYLVSAALHPDSRQTLETLSVGYGTQVIEVPLKDGATDAAALSALLDEQGDQVAAVIFQQPNFLGAIEDVQALSDLAKGAGALSICQADPIALGVLEAPGNQGVDVCVGEGQALGNRLDFGGPSFGFFAATNAHIRRMPGR